MKFLLIIIVFCALFSACGAFVEPSQAVHAMEASGFENVNVDGPKFIAIQWRGCSQSDAALFDAIGTRDGKHIHAVVCCGFLFKACTVRF